MEVFFASSVLVLLMLSVTASAFLLDTTKYESRSNGQVTDKARLVMDKMIWGKRMGGASRMSISEGTGVQLNSANQISYRQGTNIWHSIRQNGLNIEYRDNVNGAWNTIYDPDGPGVDDTENNSTTLTFSQTTPNNVIINLNLGTRHRGRWYHASLSSQVNIRNA